MVANGGTVTVGSGGAVGGTGTFEITGGGTIDILNSVDQNVTFAGAGTLEIALSQSYSENSNGSNNSVSGFGAGDAIDLQDLAYSSNGTVTWTQSTGTLAISEGGSTEDLHLVGIYNPSDFVLSGDAPGGASGGTEVVYAGPQTLTVTVDTLSGYNFQNVDPIAQMGSGTLNGGGTAASFTLVDAADDLQFDVDGTNFTYANGAVTGGVIARRFYEFTNDSTPAAIVDFTGIAENAVAWLADAQQEADHNKGHALQCLDREFLLRFQRQRRHRHRWLRQRAQCRYADRRRRQ